ncbi:MAG: MerR family transcriptional regulator [Methylobacteriaceae bacterium]|nr:MerR family transcriptional regulator [Methylobacteriaceae bacterium]
MDKSPDAFRTISEVAQDLNLPQHVLRFWETRFAQIRPLKRGGGRRYYRPEDVDLLKSIRHLLYGEGYTIRGVQRLLKEQGIKAVAALSHGALPEGMAAAGSISAAARSPDEDDETGEEFEAPEQGPPELFGSVPTGMPSPAGEGEPASAAGAATLPREAIQRLQAALFELAECERLLAAARTL